MNHPWLRTFEKRSDAQQQEVERLAALTSVWTSKIRQAFVDSVAKLTSDVDVDAIAELLRQGRAAQAIDTLNTALLSEGFQPIVVSVTDASIAAGKSAVQAMGDVPGLAGINFSFGQTNPATVAALQTYEFGLVRQLTTTARASVAQAVRVGVTEGRNPLDTARAVRGAIGLTDRQVQAVANFRRALEENPQAALDRALRDARYDPTIARAVRTQATIPPEKIDAMVERYRARYLKYRAETIARTESIRAVNFGNIDAWRQAIAAGKMPASSVTKRWIYTRDSRTRHAHRTIPTLNPDDPGIEGKFKSELGPIAYPGDPDAVAANVIRCRCAVVLRYKSPVALPVTPEPAKPKPPSPALKISFVGETTPEFKSNVKAALDKMPQAARDIVSKAGIGASFGPFVTEILPHLKGVTPRGWPPGSTWDEAEGLYAPGEKIFVVTEKVRHRGANSSYTSQRVKGVLGHEFGHALDHALGYPSNSPMFRAAYDKDLAAFLASGETRESGKYGYYVQQDDAGPSEMFAEQWNETALTGEKTLVEDQSLRLRFPSVARYMDALHKGLQDRSAR